MTNMTNEQAEEILTEYLDMNSEVKSEYLDAMRVAIKALEDKGYWCGYERGFTDGVKECAKTWLGDAE